MNGHFSHLFGGIPRECASGRRKLQSCKRTLLRIIPGRWESRLSHHRSAIEQLVRHDPCLHFLLPAGEDAGSSDSAG